MREPTTCENCGAPATMILTDDAGEQWGACDGCRPVWWECRVASFIDA